MLILSRKIGESIIIGENIIITPTAIRGNVVKLGVSAPADITIDREEIHLRKMAEKEQGGNS